MTRRYIGNVTVLIHATPRDGYLCRVTAGRGRACRLTVWHRPPAGMTYNDPRAVDAAAMQAANGTSLWEGGDTTIHRRKPPKASAP